MPSPKTPYANDKPSKPLLTNRNQRKQFEAIGEPMEGIDLTPPAAKPPRATPPPMTEKRRPAPDYDAMEREAEAQKNRKRN